MIGVVSSENGEQGSVDTPLLFRREVSGQVSQSADIDGPNLFDKDPGRSAINLDLGAERRRLRTG